MATQGLQDDQLDRLFLGVPAGWGAHGIVQGRPARRRTAYDGSAAVRRGEVWIAHRVVSG